MTGSAGMGTLKEDALNVMVHAVTDAALRDSVQQAQDLCSILHCAQTQGTGADLGSSVGTSVVLGVALGGVFATKHVVTLLQTTCCLVDLCCTLRPRARCGVAGLLCFLAVAHRLAFSCM